VIFDKDDFGGTTAEGFDADGAGSGEEIDEARTGYVGGSTLKSVSRRRSLVGRRARPLRSSGCGFCKFRR